MNPTAQETMCLDLLGMAWNVFGELPTQHGCDTAEMAFAIHAAQHIILARVGRRALGQTREKEHGPVSAPPRFYAPEGDE